MLRIGGWAEVVKAWNGLVEDGGNETAHCGQKLNDASLFTKGYSLPTRPAAQKWQVV